MSSETFTYKGISAGKYVEGTIEAISQDEANFKLKEQKIIITNITRTKKKAADKKKKSGGGLSLFKKKIKPEDVVIFSKQFRNYGKSRTSNLKRPWHAKGSIRAPRVNENC
jgi:type IV pilus assembly protein PilC